MNKEYLKSYLYGVEVKIASIITETVLVRASKVEVMKRVKKFIRGLQLFSDVEKNRLWVWTTGFYRHCIAGAARKTKPLERAEAIYAVLRNDTPMLEHVKNEIADAVEFRKKHEELIDVLSDSDAKFYYCTVHKNPADGHAEYQGRIYYKKNGLYTDEEKRYIKGQKLLSVDEVVMGPVWLCTRRNCRHRLVPISFESVKTGDYSDVRETTEISYEDGEYRLYRDRYKMMASIKKVFVDKGVDAPVQMKIDMKRTRLLVLNWDRARKEKKKKRGK